MKIKVMKCFIMFEFAYFPFNYMKFFNYNYFLRELLPPLSSLHTKLFFSISLIGMTDGSTDDQ